MSSPYRLSAVLFTATVIVACGPTNGQPESPPPTPASTTVAVAGFPDLSNFTEDNSGAYERINVSRVQGFSFMTPDGLICGNNAYPDVQYEFVGCRGPMPHEGPGEWSVRARRSQQATVESITGDPDYAADMTEPPPVLPPFHKLVAAKGEAVCAVDDEGMTACRVGDHGFVLTPTSTELF
jgi:hypothetical protein